MLLRDVSDHVFARLKADLTAVWLVRLVPAEEEDAGLLLKLGVEPVKRGGWCLTSTYGLGKDR